MGPSGAQPAFDDERDRLMAAAAELCAERGYLEITEATIAARAGVPEQRAEELFPGGKEECLVAAEQANLLEVVAAVSRAYSADRSEWDNVIYGVAAVLELMAERPGFAYLGFVAARQMAPPAVREIFSSGQRTLGVMLERGWDYSRSPTPQLARVALGALGGAMAVVRREIAAGRADRLPALLPDCVYIATVPFLGQEEAARLARRARALADGGAVSERPGRNLDAADEAP